jgi:hypothetical protein
MTGTACAGFAAAEPDVVKYTATTGGADIDAAIKAGYQKPTAGWAAVDSKKAEKEEAAKKAKKEAEEAAAKAKEDAKKADAATPQTGLCGAEDACDTTVSDVEIKCGAAKLGAGLLASLAIAASL